ncbi:MAG: hypothetical protein Q8P28_02705 [Deltaproteobacteria bacterium]|nr:hypothetical protein [Deltaproteobacteria bacterium]
MTEKNILITFLPDRKYFSELRRPWKLATFGIGMLWLLYGAVYYDICDWDVGISLIMGGLTYVFAPWSVITIYNSIRFRPHAWPLRVVAALVPAMFAVDWVYWLYHSAVGNQMLRWENLKVSMALYFICWIVWCYRGSLTDIVREFGGNAMNHEPLIKSQPTFLRRVLKFFAKAVLAFIIFTCILFIYAELKVEWAKKQVEAFNQLVVIGMPVAGLEKKAKEMHLNYRRMADSNDKDGKFFVWEGFIFAPPPK